MSKVLHEVVVGNLGTVYSGADSLAAHKAYLGYVRASDAPYGRASGEGVTWLRDDDVYADHAPAQYLSEDL